MGPLLTPSLGLIFWMTLIFLSVFFILRKFAWKPILSALSEREQDIEGALKMAEETRAEMAKLKADNDNLLTEARKQRDIIIKEAKEVADKLVAESKSNAVIEANKVMQSARESLAQERTAMMAQIRTEVAALSLEIAEKVIRKELSDTKSQQTFVSDLIADAKLN